MSEAPKKITIKIEGAEVTGEIIPVERIDGEVNVAFLKDGTVIRYRAILHEAFRGEKPGETEPVFAFKFGFNILDVTKPSEKKQE